MCTCHGQVHPDKTSCFGAENAFKLVARAVSELSPPDSQEANDTRREREADSNNWEYAFVADPEPPVKRQRQVPQEQAHLTDQPRLSYPLQRLVQTPQDQTCMLQLVTGLSTGLAAVQTLFAIAPSSRRYNLHPSRLCAIICPVHQSGIHVLPVGA